MDTDENYSSLCQESSPFVRLSSDTDSLSRSWHSLIGPCYHTALHCAQLHRRLTGRSMLEEVNLVDVARRYQVTFSCGQTAAAWHILRVHVLVLYHSSSGTSTQACPCRRWMRTRLLGLHPWLHAHAMQVGKTAVLYIPLGASNTTHWSHSSVRSCQRHQTASTNCNRDLTFV